MSFRDGHEFSLVAAGGLRERNDDLIGNVVSIDDQMSLVKTAVVYGANASGKSNLLRAIAFMAHALTEKQDDGLAVGNYQPFLLSQSKSEAPTLLEAIFLHKGQHFRYGFEVKNRLVTAEWLFVWRKQETMVFERRGGELRVGRTYPKLRELQSKQMVNSAALLVNLGALFNDDVCLEVKEWARTINYFNPAKEINNLLLQRLKMGHSEETVNYLQDEKGKSRVLELLRVADLGIDDIEIVEEKSLLGGFRQKKDAPPFTNAQIFTVRRSWEEETNSFRTVRMPLFEFESEGTRKLFTLIGRVLATLDGGGIFVADELDAKMHPLLTQRIVQLFNRQSTNPHNAQFVFATHDTNLLSAGLFRRDQIWFTEKDLKGATQLYALTDYRPDGKTVRNDEPLEKNYLVGKYGGVPYLGDFDALLESESSPREAVLHE